ncbi:MAG: hypothetical protein P8J87_14030 [Verrucomicrobiales bacterium]|nr:hypothetical protein [Verrucomicrobiales bacterium]
MKELIAIVELGRVRILSISRGGDDPNDRDHLVEEFNEDLEGVGGPLRDTVVETIAGNLTKMPVVELEKRLLR